MAGRLYLPEPESAGLLEAAADAGLAQARGEPASPDRCYQFSPATAELGELVGRLAAHYSLDIVTVTDLIHSRVDRRAQQFADAFRWRKDS